MAARIYPITIIKKTILIYREKKPSTPPPFSLKIITGNSKNRMEKETANLRMFSAWSIIGTIIHSFIFHPTERYISNNQG